jgi:short subunit dehydrogenase-like uncharacterized protein
MVCEAAICLAQDFTLTPTLYGCVTPAAGLGQAYQTRLQNAGIDFAIKDE